VATNLGIKPSTDRAAIDRDFTKKATELVEVLRPPLMNRGQYEQVMQLLERTTPADSIDADFFKVAGGV
jgi:hypothetical protein